MCDESNHYAGGTDMGRKFLDTNPQILFYGFYKTRFVVIIVYKVLIHHIMAVATGLVGPE